MTLTDLPKTPPDIVQEPRASLLVSGCLITFLLHIFPVLREFRGLIHPVLHPESECTASPPDASRSHPSLALPFPFPTSFSSHLHAYSLIKRDNFSEIGMNFCLPLQNSPRDNPPSLLPLSSTCLCTPPLSKIPKCFSIILKIPSAYISKPQHPLPLTSLRGLRPIIQSLLSKFLCHTSSPSNIPILTSKKTNSLLPNPRPLLH